MAINSDQYVSIDSVVGGASATSARELMLRVMTSNDLVPTNSTLEFSLSDSVSNYFGSGTEEAEIAEKYFSFVSKVGDSPKTISFGRYADADTSAQVFGSMTETLDNLNAYTSAAFDVTLNGSTQSVTGVDLSSAASYADVSAALQTALQGMTGFTSATVSYNATRAGFDLDTNGTADGAISFTEVTSGFLDDLGWGSLAIYSSGISGQTPVSAISSSADLNNNFGSFFFNDDLDIDEIEDIASWNASENVKYMYFQKSTKSQSLTWFSILSGYSGTGLIGYDDSLDERPWVLPASLLASIDWESTNATTNFMFTQDNSLTPLISTTTEANTYDAVRLNYMGVTQNAGDYISFFQRGRLMGGTSDPLQMGVYAGEQWLKSEATAQFLNMFLALPIISADDSGRATASKYIEDFRTQAENNGVISIGKTLTTTQKAYITSITGDTDAWQTVQREGSYYTTEISEDTSDGVTEYTLKYTFIYAKRDGVSKVEGSHVLI